MHPRRLAWCLAVVAMVVSACVGAPAGGSIVSPSPAPSGGPAGAGGLIFRVAYVGGLIAPNASRTQLPLVSVYSDGRIITQGATPAIYPGPLLPTLVVRSVGSAGAAAILKAATDAGLARADATYPPAPPPDAPTTVITVIHDGQRTVSTFGLLGPAAGPVVNGGMAGSAATEQIRAASAALIDRLMSDDSFGGQAGPDGTYAPQGFRLFVIPGSPAPADPQLARPPVAWPLATPLATFGRPDSLGGDGARTGDVTGADSATLGPILAAATQITPFSSGGKQWTIFIRPLLPDEVAAPGG
jgi:hypothetical protein